MSNRPEDDPIGHAAKFLWLFALIPLIFGSMQLFLPREMSAKTPWYGSAFPFFFAALVALVGAGVWRRMIAAAWAGIALFSVALAGLAVLALVGDPKGRATLFFVILLLWPIRKLYAAITAIRAEQARSPAP